MLENTTYIIPSNYRTKLFDLLQEKAIMRAESRDVSKDLSKSIVLTVC